MIECGFTAHSTSIEDTSGKATFHIEGKHLILELDSFKEFENIRKFLEFAFLKGQQHSMKIIKHDIVTSLSDLENKLF